MNLFQTNLTPPWLVTLLTFTFVIPSLSMTIESILTLKPTLIILKYFIFFPFHFSLLFFSSPFHSLPPSPFHSFPLLISFRRLTLILIKNIQSTNWQTVRFKPPPPGSPIGWRYSPFPCFFFALVNQS